MAVSIDTVYQRVLAVANKEQRGYITPQEFNLFANQAQMEIFDQYFYDINQFGRLPGNNTEYSDMLELLSDKISAFKKTKNLSSNITTNIFPLSFTDFYKLGTVILKRVQAQHGAVGSVEIEKLDKNEFLFREASPLTAPSFSRPVYVREGTGIKIYPLSITSNVECTYIARPSPVNWNYVVVKSAALHNSTGTSNFNLHASEENNLVYKILSLAGVSIQNPTVYQMAEAKELKTNQQEKQ
tara:strand:+ start:325 stop:1047 length:723 start_codon:yes stop_codon:yes gene_type:complete